MKAPRGPAIAAAAGAALVAATVAFAPFTGSAHARTQAAHFTEHLIDTGLSGGYQVVIADLNHDGKPDIIALASGLHELRWYENPGWQKHVIVSGIDQPINAAAWDLDGDGFPEIALAYGFSTVYANSVGNIAILTHNADPTAEWVAREIDRLPTSHRLRFADIDGSGKKVLVNFPLIGAHAVAPDYSDRTPLVMYRPGEWKRERIADDSGVVHGILPFAWNGDTRESVFSGSFAGVFQQRFDRGTWTRTKILGGDPSPWPKGGASEIVVGNIGREKYLATIEPWHGNEIVVYRKSGGVWKRHVIDDAIRDGHTMVVGDFDGDGNDEIIVGERAGGRSVYLYRLMSAAEDRWTKETLDNGGMAGAGCAVADMNGDNRPDVVCIGTATANLKWYENNRPGGDQQAEAVTVPELGALTFPVTTASNEAREDFLRGTLLLHVFHYEQARDAFRSAQQLDHGFTMAWWGEAMAWNYGVWDEQFPDSARAALRRLAPTAVARAAMARTPREREYLGTVEALYGNGSKPHRDTVYAAAVARLASDYPQDDEAKLFDALALLGLNQGVRDVPTYQRALALAIDVFRRHPDHPGASHYVIHASDDPAHAAIGLDAARALAKSSPAAEHAQHMTSHIFMALGMWDDLVTANERATHVIAVPGGAPMKMPAKMPDMKSSACGHYNSWLDYGYLAQGRIALATALLNRCERDASQVAGAVFMWSRYLLDTEAWTGDQFAWKPALGDDPETRLTYHFVRGFAAARRMAPSAADSDLVALRRARNDAAARAAKSHDSSPATVESLKRDGILDLELQAAIQSARGAHDDAVALLRQATRAEDAMAYAFGPPEIDKPSHELLGEELLLLNRGADARVEFQKALRTTPRRPMALLGLARADESAGLAAEARATWRDLADVWHAADPGMPGLDAARRKAAAP